MRKMLISAKLLMLLFVCAGNLWANCKSDYVKVNSFAVNAANAQKKGQYDVAKKLFRKAARKLSAMKYRCSSISLKEMSTKERKYRIYARYTGCGKLIQQAQSNIIKIKAGANKKQAASLVRLAINNYNSVIAKCPNSQYQKYAQIKLASIGGGKFKNNSKATINRNSGREVSRKTNRFKSVRIRRGRCYYQYLRQVAKIEMKANIAFKNKLYGDAVKHYNNAAEMYISESQKCKNAKDRLSALDRAKLLRLRVVAIKSKYVNCTAKADAAKKLREEAFGDEQSGDYDLAHDGYMNALRAYLSIPKACSPEQYTHLRKESRDRAKLLSCNSYVEGIISYNQAFSAMSKADKREAALEYGKAARYFDSAVSKCGFVAANFKLLNKLINASKLKAKRLEF